MSWKAMQVVLEFPDETLPEWVQRVADDLEMNPKDALYYVRTEVSEVEDLREGMRPLFAEKVELDDQMAEYETTFSDQVMDEYPPGKGNQKDRDAYMKKLKKESEPYQELDERMIKIKAAIKEEDHKIEVLQDEAKNGRRILETFNVIVSYLTETARQKHTPAPAESGSGIFAAGTEPLEDENPNSRQAF